MSTGEKNEHDFDGLKHVVEIRHLGIEALSSFVGELSQSSPVYRTLQELPAEVKSDLIMLWSEIFSGIVAEVADNRGVDDDSGTLGDLCAFLPGVDDPEVGDMIHHVTTYNESMIGAMEIIADYKPILN